MRLRYRGYTAILKQDLDSAVWHGRVADIQDVVSFEGKTTAQAEKEFRKAVDAYLEFCQSCNREPNPPRGLTSLSFDSTQPISNLIRQWLALRGKNVPPHIKLR